MAKATEFLVVALEIGTKYSGYAFSLKDDPFDIRAPPWNDGSSKLPTVVLFNERKEFHSFGYEAEDKYSELVMEEKHHNWYCFKRFMMSIRKHKGLREMTIDDTRGHPFPARLVFRAVILYLKCHMLKKFDKMSLMNQDIHWVLTVPTILNDAAKQLLRSSAVEAGITEDQLSLVLDPIAASMFYHQLLSDEVSSKRGTSVNVSSAGFKYMVIDIGGETLLRSYVYERQENGRFRELPMSSVVAWGGRGVHAQFKQLLIKIIGAPVLTKFKEEHAADYLNLMRDLEIRIRTIHPHREGNTTITMPVELWEMYEEETDEKVAEAIDGSLYKGKLTLRRDKMLLDADVFRGLFKQFVDTITEHINDLLCNNNAFGTTTLLIVGESSKSAMIQDTVRRACPALNVIIPKESDLCTMRGAVLYGHGHRPYTDMSPPFDNANHPSGKKVPFDGFDPSQKRVITRNTQQAERVKADDPRPGRYITLSVYASPTHDPQSVDKDKSEQVGQVVVKLPDNADKIRVNVSMNCGETELMVEAEELSTNKKIQVLL